MQTDNLNYQIYLKDLGGTIQTEVPTINKILIKKKLTLNSILNHLILKIKKKFWELFFQKWIAGISLKFGEVILKIWIRVCLLKIWEISNNKICKLLICNRKFRKFDIIEILQIKLIDILILPIKLNWFFEYKLFQLK